MSGWSWITLCATPDPVGKKARKHSWSNEQNNVGIRLIWNPKKTQIEIIISMLFSSLPFLPSPWEAPCICVQSFHPEHVHSCLESSLPEKVKARDTQSRLKSGMKHGFPCTNVLSFCLKRRVQCLWVLGSIYTYYPVPVWLPTTGSGVSHVHRPRGLCTHGPLSCDMPPLPPSSGSGDQMHALWPHCPSWIPGGSDGKESACSAGGLGGEDALEKGMAGHCGILAWRIPWTEDPGGLQSVGSQRVGHDWMSMGPHMGAVVHSPSPCSAYHT